MSNSVTVYHADNRWFIPVSNGVKEIPFAVVCEWEKAYGIEVKEMESYD